MKSSGVCPALHRPSLFGSVESAYAIVAKVVDVSKERKFVICDGDAEVLHQPDVGMSFHSRRK